MNMLITRAAAARQRFSEVKAKGIKNYAVEHGAIDLASIMVGVLVIGIVGGVIAATVFAVIPWAQDQSAAGVLDSVATAESVSFAQSSGSGAGVYQSSEGAGSIFVKDGLGADGGLLQSSDRVIIEVGTDGKSYVAYSLSDTGAIFSATNTDPNTAVKLDAAAVTAAGLSVGVDGELVKA